MFTTSPSQTFSPHSQPIKNQAPRFQRLWASCKQMARCFNFSKAAHTQHCRWTSLITSLLRNSTLVGSLLQICEAAATIIFIIFSITEQIWQHQIEFFFTKNPAPSSGSQQKVSETDGRGCTCRISYCKTDGPVANFWTNSISKSTYYLTNIPCRTP